jgi:hypothetical protein
MQLPTIALHNSSDTEDDEAEVEVFLPSKQFGNIAVDLDAVMSAAEGTLDFNELAASCTGAPGFTEQQPGAFELRLHSRRCMASCPAPVHCTLKPE